MSFTRLDMLYILLPLLLGVLIVRWRKAKNYFTHPLLFYVRRRIRPASSLVHLPKLFEYLALGSLLIALFNPVLPSAGYLLMKEGLDILLVLDLSSSMQEPIDLKGSLQRERQGIRRREKTRLQAVKEAMIEFVEKRKGDRIGVVVFSEGGYVVAPMTVDTSYLTQYLRMVDARTLAGEGQTAIGEGILTALLLAAQQSDNRNRTRDKLIVVLTDGENNAGRDLYMAIRKASEAGFKIHFIGVEVDKAPDAPRLIAAVRATGGNYYDVRDPQQLQQAYFDVSRLQKGAFFAKREVTHVPAYHPFALASLLLLGASVALRSIPYFIEIS